MRNKNSRQIKRNPSPVLDDEGGSVYTIHVEASGVVNFLNLEEKKRFKKI